MKITMAFGEGSVSAEVAPERVLGSLVTKLHEMKADLPEVELIRNAMRAPVGSPRLRELAKGKKKIVLVTSDHSRPAPSHLMIPVMLAEIREGSPDADVTILIAVGSHRATTRDEMVEKFGRELVENEKIAVHDPHDDRNLVRLGTLPSGADLIVNRLAAEADLLVADGLVEPHPFAGYSGGRKSIFPGVASYGAIMANHNSEFMAHPNARVGVLQGNPIHEDMLYAAKTTGLVFILNTIIDHEKRVVAAFAGDCDKAHLEACAFMERYAGVDALPAPIVITCNGGHPADLDIFQGCKSIQAADLTCIPGGVIIATNECRDGHGAEPFYKAFAETNSVADLLKEIMARKKNETIKGQWANQFLGQAMLRNKVILVAAPSVRKLIEDMKITYAPDLQEALRMADEHLGRTDAPITLVPNGIAVVIRRVAAASPAV